MTAPYDRQSLADLTRVLIDVPSVSGDEAAVEAIVRSHMEGRVPLAYDHDSVLFFCGERRAGLPMVVLAGHTDTVPIENNVPSRIDGDTIYGRGASDMKSGLAVMLALATELSHQPCTDLDFAFLFFGREELPASENALLPALAASDLMRSADLAILMEPTDNALEAGCQGNLNVTLTFFGAAAHTARPWTGFNAAHQAVLALQEVANDEPADVDIDGLIFREVASVTGMRSGVARNVVPPKAEVDINIRYSPGRQPAEVEAMWVGAGRNWGADVSVVSNALPAPVVVNHPLAQRLLSAGAGRPMPKQAWTNAADFAAHGIAAVNFGPGDPLLAHTAHEHVSIDALDRSLEVLRRFAGIQ